MTDGHYILKSVDIKIIKMDSLVHNPIVKSFKRLRTNAGDQNDPKSGSVKLSATRTRDMYEYNPDEFLVELQQHVIYRPLPSADTLIAASYQQTTSANDGMYPYEKNKSSSAGPRSIPLLDDFFRKIRNKDSNIPSDNADSNEKVDSIAAVPLSLDRTSTVLTDGHHKRFRELLQVFGPTAPSDALSRLSYPNQISRKREWNAVQTLIVEERKQYAEAWEQFKTDHVDRFLLGFKNNTNPDVSYYAGRRAEYIQQYQHRWLNCATQPFGLYGSCVQTISLIQNVKLDLSDLDQFSPKILHRKMVGSGGNIPRISVQELKNHLEGSYLHKLNVKQYLDSESLLCEDDTAKDLASKHDCDVIMTADGLESILRSQQWNLSMSSPFGKAMYIEDPIPSCSGPRECLSYGFRVGLIHHILEYLKHDSAEYICGEHIYSMVHFHIRNTNIKVLVRSYVFIHDENGKPIVFDCQPMYFSELGEDEPSGNDRGLWFMQKLLLGDSTLLCCSVDVHTSAFMFIKERGISDALQISEILVSEKNLQTLGIFENILKATSLEKSLQVLMNVLSGVTIIERDGKHSIIQYSASIGDFASVHKGTLITDLNCIDIRNVLHESANVFQNKVWLLNHEFRLWKWRYHRIPFTFQLER